jgi:hypothetical protein
MIDNFNAYKFHPSSLPALMTNPRPKSQSKPAPLSKACRDNLDEIFALEFFGREKFLITKQMYKGTAVESESLTLYEKVTGEKYFKNNKQLENDWLIGTPDVIAQDRVIDIKSAWDLLSLMKLSPTDGKKYYYQLVGYCLLTGKRKAEIARCLVNTPEDLIDRELFQLNRFLPNLDNDDELLEKVKLNFVFDDIEPRYRVHRTSFEVLEGDLEEIKERVGLWRAYLNSKLLALK